MQVDSRFPNYFETREYILSAKDPWLTNDEPTEKELRAARKGLTHVVGNLFLSNDERFVEAMGANPQRFEVIITVCPIQSMVSKIDSLKHVDFQQVEKELQARGIEWHQIGRSAPDDPGMFRDLAFNGTKPKSELAQKEMNIPRKSKDPAHKAFREKKWKELEAIPVEQWFGPIFAILNRAAFQGKKTLIHCHAGASRSPAILIPWLSMTFDVPSDKALAYLRSRRICASPKCIAEIRAYEAAAKQAIACI